MTWPIKKNERNSWIQSRWDELWAEGKHGHYETLFRIVAEAVMQERERCAKACEKRAKRRFEDHGTRESETNATYYAGSNRAECEIRDEEDEDCAAAIRALGEGKDAT